MANPHDFIDRFTSWCRKASPQQIVSMINTGLSRPEALEKRISHWCGCASPSDAITLVQSGLVGANTFAKRLNVWGKKITPAEAIDLVKAKIAKPIDFSSIECATALVSNNYAERRDYFHLINHWVESATVYQAISYCSPNQRCSSRNFDRGFGCTIKF